MPDLEQLLTPAELAALWKVHPSTIQRMFEDEKGVWKHGRETRRSGKRKYVTLRIPLSVAQRVYEQHSR